MADHSECADVPVPTTPLEAEAAMAETCKEVPAEECVVHVLQGINLYTRLRFSPLASSWLPRPVGVCLWSVLHAMRAVYVPVILLALFSTVLVLAVFVDALMSMCWLWSLPVVPLIILYMYLLVFLGACLASVVVWIWLVISFQCCTMAGRPPGQNLCRYILFPFDHIGPRPPPGPVEESGPAARPAPGLWTIVVSERSELWRRCLK